MHKTEQRQLINSDEPCFTSVPLSQLRPCPSVDSIITLMSVWRITGRLLELPLC